MKTIHPKTNNITHNWHLIDADSRVLGRLASEIVRLLMGKNKVQYSPHADVGGFVVVINSEKIKVTGRKESQKKYYRHSGYPGALKTISYSKMKSEHPARIIELAVRGMMPKNRLRKVRMKRLRLVVGDKNPYVGKFNENEKEN